VQKTPLPGISHIIDASKAAVVFFVMVMAIRAYRKNNHREVKK